MNEYFQANIEELDRINIGNETEQWMMDHNLLNDRIICPRCQRRSINRRHRYAQSYFRCRHHDCRWEKRVQDNSFFYGFLCPLILLLKAVFYYWSNETVDRIREYTGLTRYAIQRLINRIDALVFAYQEQYPTVFDPADNPVCEIDEGCFHRFHYGRRNVHQWWFGIRQRGSTKVFVQRVDNRSARTLLPIIRDRIIAGMTICSDEWRAYANLEDEGYFHFTVNHSQREFARMEYHPLLDRDFRVTTNRSEAGWQLMRDFLRVHRGTRIYNYDRKFAVFVFKRNNDLTFFNLIQMFNRDELIADFDQ